MKFFIAFAALVAIAYAANPEDAAAVVEKSVNDNNPDGSYHYSQQLSNGISQDEQGTLTQLVDADNKPVQAITVKGSYSYVGPDGQKVVLDYVADQNGFQPQGSHLPVAPVPLA